MPHKTPYLILCLLAGLTACNGNYSGGRAISAVDNSDTPSSEPDDPSVAGSEAYFDTAVAPHMDFCRTCHVPDGVADAPEGERFLLSQNASDDYDNTYAAWLALGKGVQDNMLLIEPSDPSEAHSGGKPWPPGSDGYIAMRSLLQCWDDPANCGNPAELDDRSELLPLLGNPGKHFFVNRLCDGAPDNTVIEWNRDPRRLLQENGFDGSASLIDSDNYAVHFNDPYEICHTDTLFETQARQNQLREAVGQKPIYSARRDPATCGQWRSAVQRGHDWIAMTPTDQPLHDSHGAGALDAVYGGTTALAWNNLWRVWGLDERPQNFDEHIFERYGHSPPQDHIYNPYPIVDPANGIDERSMLSENFGGSGRLPLGYAQGRTADGRYSGTLGLTCFSCHAGQIGSGQVGGRDGNHNPQSYGANATGSFMGLPNTNTELGVLIADLINARHYEIPFAENNPIQVPAVGYIPLVNTTRGTNAADTEIEAIVAIRDFDTLEFSHVLTYPLHASMGDQDPPAWWWLSNKTRYLWFGGHSTDSSRGNMYFGSVNGLSGEQVKENEGTFEDVHQWTLTVEAPDYPYGYCSGENGKPAPGDHPGCINRSRAEQGAILFHEKNLWADEENSDIPQPKGNGACAGCHGAYSPRYVNDSRFLPSPDLAGMVGYTVPIEIINTDPAQAEGWAMELREHISTFWWSYPDAVEGYRLPENKPPLTEILDDYTLLGVEGSDFADHLARSADRTGTFQPLSDFVDLLGGTLLDPLPAPALGEATGRIKGACSFEEKTVGYVTPPLHGVWASAPYFHNGSVPNIWSVLKPEDRPTVWRRQRTTTPVHFNAFETRIDGVDSGYDWQKLGWNYDDVSCGAGSQGIPFYTCDPGIDVPQEIQWTADAILGGILWPTWVVPPPLGEAGLADRMIFNTHMYSKKNRGHEWTKTLTDNERHALMEYLKTL